MTIFLIFLIFLAVLFMALALLLSLPRGAWERLDDWLAWQIRRRRAERECREIQRREQERLANERWAHAFGHDREDRRFTWTWTDPEPVAAWEIRVFEIDSAGVVRLVR
jgi:hypothetical protein